MLFAIEEVAPKAVRILVESAVFIFVLFRWCLMVVFDYAGEFDEVFL